MTNEQREYFRGGFATIKHIVNGVEHLKINHPELVTVDNVLRLITEMREGMEREIQKHESDQA